MMKETQSQTEHFVNQISILYQVAEKFNLGNPDKLDICNVAFQLRGMKPLIESSEKLQAENEIAKKLVLKIEETIEELKVCSDNPINPKSAVDKMHYAIVVLEKIQSAVIPARQSS